MAVPDKKMLVDMLRKMIRIRMFEEKASELYRTGLFGGSLHLYIGEEAIATGVCTALDKDDLITSTHRGHGHIIAKDGDVKKMMAELLGKKSGYCKGKGGSLHIAYMGLGILGANGVVGAGIPIATGAALSAQYRETNQVVACFFGDAAVNQGSFHESLNLAAVWRLPVVFVCENNLYGVFTAQGRVRSIENIYERASAYGIPGKEVDGNDILGVYRAAKEAVDRARSGNGPTLVECRTYRWRGHWDGDPLEYRDDTELEEWMQRDPIKRFKERLLKEKIITQSRISEIENQVQAEIEEAVKYGQESEEPAPQDALLDLYS